MSIRRANYVTSGFGSKALQVTGQDVAELGTKRPNDQRPMAANGCRTFADLPKSASARLGHQQGHSTTSSAVATSDGRYGKANCLGGLEVDL